MTSDPFKPGAVQVIERVTLSAPLGLRFWDTVTQTNIGAGLVVTIFPMQNKKARLEAVPNRSGIYVFQRLPGLDEITIEPGSGPIWTAPGPGKGFVLEVYDRSGRFLPFQLPITELPRGVYNWTCPTLSPLSPASSTPLPNVPLFSSPSRPIPPGMAVVRADLRQLLPGVLPDPNQPKEPPAAWAVLSVLYKGKLLARGLASRAGSALVMIPYPQPAISVSGPSGLLNTPVSLNQQRWDISLKVQFYPASQIPDPFPEFPDLCEVLTNPQVSPLGSISPLAPLGQQSVRYGQDMVVKTGPYSELFFTNP